MFFFWWSAKWTTKKTERIAIIGLIVFLVGYFCYQMTYGIETTLWPNGTRTFGDLPPGSTITNITGNAYNGSATINVGPPPIMARYWILEDYHGIEGSRHGKVEVLLKKILQWRYENLLVCIWANLLSDGYHLYRVLEHMNDHHRASFKEIGSFLETLGL